MFYKSFLLKIVPIFLMLFAFPLYGKKIFRSPYVSFDIGNNWVCKSFGVDWVCHHYLYKEAKPSLMLITAKEGKSSDNLNLYTQAFNKNQTASSKKIHTNKISVNRHAWIESLYKNDLLKSMFNRYVATVCCDKTNAKIHIFIGFHAHQENYTKYSNEFLRSIKTLKLASNLSKALEQIRKQTDQQKKDMLSYIERILSESEGNRGIQKNNKNSDLLINLLFLGFILFLAGFLFYFLYYKNKKKTQRSRRTKRKLYKHKQKRHK